VGISRLAPAAKLCQITIMLGLDLDGVIIDHTENRLKLAKRFGFSLEPSETPVDILKTKIPPDIHARIKEALYDDPRIALTPPLVTGALAGLEELKIREVPLFLISRRNKNEEFAVELLKKRGVWPFYLNESNTFFVKTAGEKNERAAALGVTTYLDDQPSVIEALHAIPAKFLFDPHGVYAYRPEAYRKVASWHEFLSQIL